MRLIFFKTTTLPVLAAGALLLNSCAVGDDYERPKTEIPGSYKSAGNAEKISLASDWWLLFEDEDLNRLEALATQGNFDIRAAAARLAQARATSAAVESAIFPSITFDPSFTRGRTSANIGSGNSNAGSTRSDWRVPFDLSYEIDIWGRIRRNIEQAQEQTLASETDYAVALQTVQGDIAQNYFGLRALDSQDIILDKFIEISRRQLALTETKNNAGLAPQSDVLQARTQLDTTIAQQTEVRRQRAVLEHALAILIGQPPAALNLERKPIQTKIPEIPAGLPADLLGQRPDVAGAEHRLAAACAAVGASKANFYPKFTLTGTAGWESIDTRNLFDWQSRIWSLGPALSLPIFEGGKLSAELEQAKSVYDESEAGFRQAILVAFRDVEDSLSNLRFLAQNASAQDSANESSREFLRLAQMQYNNGLKDYFQVIDADRTLLSGETASAQIQGNRLTTTVALIKALGGGWDKTVSPPETPATGPGKK